MAECLYQLPGYPLKRTDSEPTHSFRWRSEKQRWPESVSINSSYEYMFGLTWGPKGGKEELIGTTGTLVEIVVWGGDIATQSDNKYIYSSIRMVEILLIDTSGLCQLMKLLSIYGREGREKQKGSMIVFQLSSKYSRSSGTVSCKNGTNHSVIRALIIRRHDLLLAPYEVVGLK